LLIISYLVIESAIQDCWQELDCFPIFSLWCAVSGLKKVDHIDEHCWNFCHNSWSKTCSWLWSGQGKVCVNLFALWINV